MFNCWVSVGAVGVCGRFNITITDGYIKHSKVWVNTSETKAALKHNNYK